MISVSLVPGLPFGMHVGWALTLLLAAAAGCNRPELRVEDSRGEAAPVSAAQAIERNSGVVQSDMRRELAPPKQVEAYIDLARALEAQGNVDGAIASYQKAIEVGDGGGRFQLRGRVGSDSRALAHRRLAALYDRIGQFSQSEVQYREALRLSPDDPKVWNDHGYSKYLQRRWPEAERALRTAARLSPDDARVQTNLGLCLAASGKTEEALEALSRVAGPAIGHANMGYILASMGKTEEARSHYAQALAIRPDLAPARAAVAQLDREATAPKVEAIAAGPSRVDPSLSRTSGTATR